jgi:sigma-B regulation protein RsbU (phosphoserine phosphatase)
MPGSTGATNTPADAAPPAPDVQGVQPVSGLLIERQLQAVQQEVTALREEIDLLRRRDEAINTYMRRLDEELRLAARLQRDFLPKTMPQVGRVRFHTLFRPAGYVSGDLYDVMRLDEKTVGFYLADAVGHGVPAALLTMFCKHALQTKEIASTGDAYRLLDPSEALRRVNQRLIEQELSHSTFATALYGTIHCETLHFTVSRAGHPAPIIMRAGGLPEVVQADGSLLGIFPDETYDSCSTRLRSGDRVILYTDGVEVAYWGSTGIDTWRWQDELMKYASLTAEQLLAEFSQRLDQSAGSLEPKDDLTIIVAEVEPEPA